MGRIVVPGRSFEIARGEEGDVFELDQTRNPSPHIGGLEGGRHGRGVACLTSRSQA